jgi:hypothetical protein
MGSQKRASSAWRASIVSMQPPAASVQARLRAARKSAKFHRVSSFFIAPAPLAALLSGGLLLLLRLARR